MFKIQPTLYLEILNCY